MEARADPMARQPALVADVARLQSEACAAVRSAPSHRLALRPFQALFASWRGLRALTAQARGAAATCSWQGLASASVMATICYHVLSPGPKGEVIWE